MPPPGRRFPVGASLLKHRDAATAVEFGLVSVVFLGTLLFICELGFYLYVQLSLDHATAYAARQMLTGQNRPANGDFTSFFASDLCPALSGLLNCTDGTIVVNVMPVTSYATVPPPTSLLTDGKKNPAAVTLVPGQNGSLMVLQVIYLGTTFWPFFSLPGETFPIVSTAAYVNEI